jgi:hypothetical protein
MQQSQSQLPGTPSSLPRASQDTPSPSPTDPCCCRARRGREEPPRDEGCMAKQRASSSLPMRLGRLDYIADDPSLAGPYSGSWFRCKRTRLLSRVRTGHHDTTSPHPGSAFDRCNAHPAAPFQVLRIPFGTGIDRAIRWCAVVRALSHRRTKGPAQDSPRWGSDEDRF